MSELKRHPSKVWSEIVVDEKDRTVATFSTHYRTEAEVEEFISLFINAPAMKMGLEAIARKAPHAVGVSEAADMAVEFHAIAKKLLQRMNAVRAQDAVEVGVG